MSWDMLYICRFCISQVTLQPQRKTLLLGKIADNKYPSQPAKVIKSFPFLLMYVFAIESVRAILRHY